MFLLLVFLRKSVKYDVKLGLTAGQKLNTFDNFSLKHTTPNLIIINTVALAAEPVKENLPISSHYYVLSDS
jgi:hypothetical protein